MKFQAHSKNLRILIKTPWQEKASNGDIIKNHEGEDVQFRNGWYETDDERIIGVLTGHRIFSAIPNLPGMFWVYKDIADIHAEQMLAKDREIEELKKRLGSATPAPEAATPVQTVPPPKKAAPVTPPVAS